MPVIFLYTYNPGDVAWSHQRNILSKENSTHRTPVFRGDVKQVENSRHYYTTMLRQIVKLRLRPRGDEVYVSGGETFNETDMLLYFLLLQSAMVRWMRLAITRRLPLLSTAKARR